MRDRRPHPRFTWPTTHPVSADRLTVHRMALSTTTMHTPHASDPLADLRCEQPDADGVRRKMVARVRRLIADGYYDAPGRWERAEDRLFDHVEAND